VHPEHPTTLKVAFHTLGCRLNQYDTEVMKTRLPRDLRCEVVDWDDAADVYILNSCTVTGKADQKCRQLARRAKRRSPDAKIVVTGCYAQTQPEALAEMEELDGVVGINEREDINEWLPRLLAAEHRLMEVSQYSKRLAFRSHRITDFDGRTRAFVKIQDGCDLRCTYCLIWKARGPGRSRDLDDVVGQIEELRRNGFSEIVLTGVHMGSYGRDIRYRPGLIGLIDAVAERFPDLRFRLSSIHPNEVDAKFLELFERHANLRPYLHVSMQSGSDAVLQRMRRPYAAEDVARAVHAAADLAPHFGIGADVIVGFPGETDEEFEETRAMIASGPFSYLHVFRYSSRPGTKAADMKPCHTETITERSAVLRELSREKRAAFEAGLVGRSLEATVETDRPVPGWIHATTGNYATVLVPDAWEPGTPVLLTPEGVRDGTLYTERVEALTPSTT
jgi:threonylcarbamoyladenosine tRNA methylthiotransferase MtaB